MTDKVKVKERGPWRSLLWVVQMVLVGPAFVLLVADIVTAWPTLQMVVLTGAAGVIVWLLIGKVVRLGFTITEDGIERAAGQRAPLTWDQVKALEWREAVEERLLLGSHSLPSSNKGRGVHLYARRRRGEAVQLTETLCTEKAHVEAVNEQVSDAWRRGLIPDRVTNRLHEGPVVLG